MFSEFGWPQWVMVFIIAAQAIHRSFEASGWEPKRPSPAVMGASVVTRPLILVLVLYFGGFFG